jgi:hypothetical protein
MKKIFSFLSLLLILFLILACDLPDKIHFTGTPKIKFAAGLDFTDLFAALMGDAFNIEGDDLIVKNCADALDCMTYLIRMELVNKEILTSDIPGYIPERDFTLPSKFTMVNNFKTELPLSEFGNTLNGFKFNTANIQSKIYIDGSPFVGNADVKLDFDTTPQVINNPIPLQSSGIVSGGEYRGQYLPVGGETIDVKTFLEKQENLNINLDVSLPVGTLIQAADLSNPRIAVELLIWLPLDFKYGAASEFKLDGLDDLGDFLSSLATNSDNMVKSLTLGIGFDNNPFKDGKFIAKHGDNELFDVKMESDSISFNVSSKDIAYINEFKEKNNEAEFVTDSIIKFDKGGTLKIPQTLKIMSIYLEADLENTISIMGGE